MTTILLAIATAALFALLCWTAWLLFSTRRRYAPILDIDAALAARRKELSDTLEKQTRVTKDIQQRTDADNTRHASEEAAAAARRSEEEAFLAAHRAQEEASLADLHKRSDENFRQRTDEFEAKFKAAAAEDAKRQVDQDVALANARRQNDEHLAKKQIEFDDKNVALKNSIEQLQKQLDLLEENLEDMSCGIYKPHYDFSTSAEYKAKLDGVWERQKTLVHANEAVHFADSWTINGSAAEGAKMQKQYGKLLLRAFNGECDASIARVAWNNATRMEERIRKAFEAINELGGVMHISITPQYMELRIEELRLSFEAEDKKHAEVEEQRRIRAKMREEEKVQHELDEAKRKAEADEEHYARALEAARAEVATASGAKLEHLNTKVEQLQQQLAQAQQAKERAISQAQLTKSGHIYVISNIGSFGEGVYKIGMTRRLEPRDRIDELSDASVPFGFDVHGMIHSDDAPGLEHAIHQHFEDRQINRVNRKKEFFRISLNDLDAFARAKELKLELTMLAEAREYRQTKAMMEQTATSKGQDTSAV